MAVHTEENVQMSGGFSKQIDEGAKQLIFDNLQRFQYQYPIKSTVRELVSNGLDSIREKNIASSILMGLSKVSDHYEEREGEVYKDSHFDPEYYEQKFLSPDDTVYIIYKEDGVLGKHTVLIRDFGVGLGYSRLAGYFNLGYSSKRLSRYPLGKFGLGAKSPLSTGAPFYTVTSRHNGWEYQFNVYAHKAESIIPRMELTGEINDSFTLPGVVDAEGKSIVMYRRKTEQYNMLEINLQVKQHHRQQYLDAVTSQLLYFDNVKLLIETDNGTTQVDHRAKIMYEDDYIILAENSSYTKPHILLNNVNYGLIDFKELELEERTGSVGIKVLPDQVSVNPSREALIWDDTTREVVINRFNEVLEIAGNILSKELHEEDFFRWVKACSQVEGRDSAWYQGRSSNTVTGRLASIVDMNSISLKYTKDPKISYNYYLFAGILNRLVEMSYRTEGSQKLKRVDYSGAVRGSIGSGLPIVLQHSTTSNRKNKYILENVYKGGFVNIIVQKKTLPVHPSDITNKDMIRDVISTFKDGRRKDVEQYDEEFAKERIARLHNYILSSTEYVWYEDIEVPENYSATDDVEEEQVEEIEVKQAEINKISSAERRAQSGHTLVHALRATAASSSDSVPKPFEFAAIDVPFSKIDHWTNKEIYWGSNADIGLLYCAGLISRPFIQYNEGFGLNNIQSDYNKWKAEGYSGTRSAYDYCNLYAFHDNSPVRLFKVSQQNSRYFKDFQHITSFFKVIKNKTITMANKLIQWNTARLMAGRMDALKFLKGFTPFSSQHADAYKKMEDYVGKHYREMGMNLQGAEVAPLVSHMDKVMQLQLFVRTNPDDKESIAALVKELFNPESNIEITDGRAVDAELLEEFDTLYEWSSTIRTMLNLIPQLTSGNMLGNEEIQVISEYIRFRGIQL